jgi:type I restriction enzyme S subunit
MVTKYKQTEIGTIPDDWDVKVLGELASPKARIGWQNLRKDEYLDSGSYMLITGTDFENGRIHYETCKYVSKARYEQDENIQVKNGDVLITKDGTLGKIAMVQNLHMPATLNAGVFVLTHLSDAVNNGFLYQYLRTERLMKYAEKTSTGGTIQHLNQGVLVNFPVPIPPMEEQRRIAQSLSDMDALIAQSEQVVEKYQALKQTCLQHMFPRQGQTEPDMRLPGFTGAWEQRKLGDIVRVKGRIGFRGYTQKDIITREKGGILTFSPTNIVDNQLTLKVRNTYITQEKYDESPEIQVKNGDILFVKTGSTLGKSALVSRLLEPASINPQIVVIRSDQKIQYFLFSQLISESIQKQVFIAKIGGAVPTMTEAKIKDFDIFIPNNFKESEQIGKFFADIDYIITLHQRKCKKLKLMKQGMMEELLTGKVRLV